MTKREIEAGVILGERALILDTRATESVQGRDAHARAAGPQADVPKTAAGLSGDRENPPLADDAACAGGVGGAQPGRRAVEGDRSDVVKN